MKYGFHCKSECLNISISFSDRTKQQPQNHSRLHFPQRKRLCYNSNSMWLFHLHSTVENTAFFPVFSLAGSTAKAFFRLSLWNFKEKASTVFYNTAFFIWLCHSTRLFCFSNILKIYTFSPIFPLVGSVIGDFIGYFFEISRK